MTIHLTKYGQGSPLVLLHGWGFDSQVWLPLVPTLELHYELILVDLPGFGQSSMMDWFFFKNVLLKQLPATFALLGWSLGGLYALRLALEHPERIAFLLTVCSSPCFVENRPWPGVPGQVLKNFQQKLLINPEATLKEFLELQTKYTPGYTAPKSMPSLAGLESGLNNLASWDLRAALSNLHLPACFLFGIFDALAPAKVIPCMKESHPQFNYFLFKNSAHMPFLSQKELFIEIIRELIR
ncbi:MAG: alpha/beta fold hydrolase [Legionella sp.]|nr:alpha/beta fold hydrolase [Legionella sp.]